MATDDRGITSISAGDSVPGKVERLMSESGGHVDSPLVEIDYGRMHRERVARAQGSLKRRGIGAVLVFNPLNVRYVSYPGIAIVTTLYYTYRWALIPAEGKVILWEPLFPGQEPGRQADSAPDYFTGEIRPAHGFSYFLYGPGGHENARLLATEVVDVLAERGLTGERIGIDRLDGIAVAELTAAGVEVCDGQVPLDFARSIKTVDELALLRENARTTAVGLGVLQERLVPGVTENQLWGSFMGSVLSDGAEYSGTRMLSSGQRTNPWMQEATNRVVQRGELVGLDTDLCGRFGYMTDVSRTYLCGDKPTDDQRRLYQDAYEFVYGNIPDMRVGASIAELGEKLKARCPEEYFEQRYVLLAHGVGVCDEYPSIKWADHYEGELEASMVLSVEAYCGRVGGRDGVKLEEQIILGGQGPEIITSCANHDERLLS
jgi:Xaa-Pro aminopeptidase